MQSGESRLDSTLLARQGEPDPFGAATSFLINRSLQDGLIHVTGDLGSVEQASVIFMTDAVRATVRAMSAHLNVTSKAMAKAARHKPGGARVGEP